MSQHPLVQAVFDTLPARDKSFPGEQRTAWLKMMATAFDVAYGVGGEDLSWVKFTTLVGTKALPGLADVKPEPPKPLAKPGPQFIIDEQGFARSQDGAQVNPGDVADVIYDKRGEQGDLGAIIWADGSRGVKGHHLEIALHP